MRLISRKASATVVGLTLALVGIGSAATAYAPTPVPSPTPVAVKVTPSVKLSCAAGKPALSIYAVNGEKTYKADIRVTAPAFDLNYKATGVLPGKAAYKYVSATSASLPASKATIAAYYWDGAAGHYQTWTANLPAINCG